MALKRPLGVSLAVALVACLAPGAGQAKPAGDITLAQISVRFLYATSGAVSDDLAGPDAPGLWNSIIGAGPNDEPAEDALVGVLLTSPQDEENLAIPLVVTARGPKGQLIARRTFKGVFVKHGRTTQFLLLPDVGCAGKVTIQAAFAAQARKTTVNFACGE